ncbi:hypothetical protein [Deinococcus aerophilus]|nr:hypothetical protein [Deinococcus aerophilus]
MSLRRQAERQLRASGVSDAHGLDAPALRGHTWNQKYLLQQHELQVHQIELGLQMEELERNNAELERMRDVY